MTTINTPTGGDEGGNNKKVGLVNETKNKVSEALDIPQELKDYREAWKEKIRIIDTETKNKIMDVAEKIPVKVETDSDGSKLVEFKLGNKIYKILNPKLNPQLNPKLRTPIGKHRYYNPNFKSITTRKDYTVKLRGMRGDNVDEWKNQELKEYVKEKQSQGLHIPKIEEIRHLLNKLGEKAGLDSDDDEIAMLMYLTGMDGWYWLSMGSSEKSGSQDTRSELHCDNIVRWLTSHSRDEDAANLCMISCE